MATSMPLGSPRQRPAALAEQIEFSHFFQGKVVSQFFTLFTDIFCGITNLIATLVFDV